MKVSDRLKLAQRLTTVIVKTFSPDQVDLFLRAFGADAPTEWDWNNDCGEEAVRRSLSSVGESTLGEIVDDLGLDVGFDLAPAQPPTLWLNASSLRVFLSHISKDKDKATRLRDCLAKRHMSGFVAHVDIEPTLDWQVQIDRALRSMDLFVSIHTPGFKDSFWAQQETGFAVARGTKIIPVAIGEDPTGFIARNQALLRGRKNAEQVASEILALVQKDERTQSFYKTPYDDLNDDVLF